MGLCCRPHLFKAHELCRLEVQTFTMRHAGSEALERVLACTNMHQTRVRSMTLVPVTALWEPSSPTQPQACPLPPSAHPLRPSQPCLSIDQPVTNYSWPIECEHAHEHASE